MPLPLVYTPEALKRVSDICARTFHEQISENTIAGSIQFLGGQEDNPLLDAALSPEDGALTSIFAAAHPSVWAEKEKYGGGYLMPFGQLHDVSENAKNLQLAADLWKASEEAVSNIVV